MQDKDLMKSAAHKTQLHQPTGPVAAALGAGRDRIWRISSPRLKLLVMLNKLNNAPMMIKIMRVANGYSQPLAQSSGVNIKNNELIRKKLR